MMQAGYNQPHQAAEPQPAVAAAGVEQCSSQQSIEAKPRPASDTRGSPASSPDRKRQALAYHATDTIASGSFGVQAQPSRIDRKFEAFLADLAHEAAKRGL